MAIAVSESCANTVRQPALAASAASLAPQPQRALPTTLQRQAATAALAGAVVASPLAAVALSVDVTDINSPPVVDLPVLGRFGVSPSKAKPTVKVSGDLVGTALSAKDGKVKVTVSTPKIGPLPALDDEDDVEQDGEQCVSQRVTQRPHSRRGLKPTCQLVHQTIRRLTLAIVVNESIRAAHLVREWHL